MNRSIDLRSDLYSLGVTFYEMFVGQLPFAAADPMGWVHCHIAKQPVPPSLRRNDIPNSLSAIILKLLAKAPEERYQTAAGVEADLTRCLSDLVVHGQSEAFPLGTNDFPHRFVVPEKLYGREEEIRLLVASLERVINQGTMELVLVSGYSGVGKSSVVNELHKALVSPRGLFASGKFDQYKRDIPYATLAQAFRTLVRQILGVNDTEIARWRHLLEEALGPNGQLIVNLIPELELIIGRSSPIQDLPAQDAKNRFQLVLRRFIGVFARAEHPLVLFLDDLQWLDAATLELIEHLATDPEVRHLLLVGAYRDNEVDAGHPLMRTLQEIRTGGALVQDIVLSPLRLEDLAALTAETLHCQQAHSAPLAKLIQEKTRGNPFFAIQFFSALADEKLIAFDLATRAWTWDLTRILAKGYTDNVVDLMVAKLNRLPEPTQNSLKQLACVGNSASIATLQLVYKETEGRLHDALWEANRLGLVSRSLDTYSFAHDRIQEAAYALIPEGARAELHLRIGRTIASQIAAANLPENIFEIVNHLNRGAELIHSLAERKELAELNLIAGKRAKATSAFASAVTYFAAGCELVSNEGWQYCHELAFALSLQLAECEYMTGELASAKDRLTVLLDRAVTRAECAAVTCLSIDLHTNLDRADMAVDVGFNYLRQVGFEFSLHPTDDEVNQEYERIWQRLGSRPIEELVNLPPLTHLDHSATLDVLTSVHAPANFIDGNLLALIIGRMVSLSLEHGNGDASPFAYVYFGMIMGSRFGKHRDGFRFGKVGVELLERSGGERFKARVLCNFGNAVNSWARHVRTSCEVLNCACTSAQDSGDSTFMAYSITNLISALLGAGDRLSDVQQKTETALTLVQQARFSTGVDLILGQLGLIRALAGQTAHLSTFNHPGFDESTFEQHLQ
ncbi:MAG TPA: AAA family ATPase, partial [Schlesneria sp.]